VHLVCFIIRKFFDFFREKKLFDGNDMKMGAIQTAVTLYQSTLNNILEGLVFKICEYAKSYTLICLGPAAVFCL
jgi:hypothetical protein